MQVPLKKSSAARVGWGLWWLDTVFAVGGLIYGFFTPSTSTDIDLRFLGIVLVGIFFIFEIITQILTGLALYQLRRTNNYAWPIILIIIGVLGHLLYLIPGIWALVELDKTKKSQSKPAVTMGDQTHED